MASLTIRSLDEKLKALLRLEAARHGRSMEEEARLAERINRRFAGLRAHEIELPARRTPRMPPNWTPGK